ncbi:hypothetical protein A9Q76_09110 [Arcobacter sp. 31_11_sub10_T18]|nr:hypothetical protein A9Q76_09110 [Arcobacter sp. 31_11_sub10_T18]
MVKKKLTFHINNMAYSINVDSELEDDLKNFLPQNQNVTTQELLLAYIKKTQEFARFKKEIEDISNKLPSI